MARYTTFTVVCKSCGHKNRPAPSPRLGVQKVLSGEWNTCRACGVEFNTISVPKRPIVTSALHLVNNVSPRVKVLEYSGRVPQAMGFA